MKTRNIITIVAAAAILTFAVGCIICGVANHEEVTFEEGGPEWSLEAFPLGVQCQGYTLDQDERCETVEAAIGVFNDRVGFDFFEWGSSEPVVFYLIGVPQKVGSDREGNGLDDEGNLFYAGELTALIRAEGVANQCHVQISNTGGDTTLWIVSYHGAGHCAGLGHDPADYWISIMREYQIGDLEELDPVDLPGLTDFDRAAIRARYGRQ